MGLANAVLNAAQKAAGATAMVGLTPTGAKIGINGELLEASGAATSDPLAIKSLGVRPDSLPTLAAQETWLGSAFNHIIGFAETANASGTWADCVSSTASFIATFASSGREIKWAIPICTGANPIADTISGARDIEITQIAEAIAAGHVGSVIDIRPGWEPNFSTSYPWGSTLVTTAEYIAAFRRVTNIFRSVDKRFRVCYCASMRVDTAWPFEGMYPGDDFVDVIGVDAYMMQTFKGAMTDVEHVEFMFSGPCGINRFRDFAYSHNKMLAINEWGLDYDNPYYIERIADFVRTNSVVYHAYWDQNNGAFQCKLSADQWPNCAHMFVRNFGPFNLNTWALTATPGQPLYGRVTASKPIRRTEVVAGGQAFVVGADLIAAAPQVSGTRRITVKAYDERGQSAQRSIALTWQNGRLWTPAELGANLGDWMALDFDQSHRRHILAIKSVSSIVGTGRDATALTAAQRPTFGYQSGIPGATLDGGDALVQTVMTGVPAAQAAVTYAAMLYTDPAVSSFTYWAMDADTGAGVRGVGVNGGNLRMGAAGGAAGGSVTGQHSVVVSFGAGATASVRGTIDGNTASTGSVAIPSVTYTRRVIGANAGAAGAIGSYYLGRLHEFFCASVAFNSGQEDQAHGYLAWKYGLEGNLPGGHAYKLAPPVV